ncbi:hypothetical protein PVAND_010928 [Polypedilum vanderplanki]|uniref:Coiled-coil protein 142 C-terminal domain-containing protein n=1 Tax=Polypedilum vanderplanki TaxID=319348 RepID=A0A9J6CHS4_POLVA|nr:hypothetical protein PVAND_010928 [Polypedilum vanderplanki]
MSSNISKWFPRVSMQQTNDKVFGRTRAIERELKILAKKFSTNINFNLLDYYAFQTLLEQGNVFFQDSCMSQYKLYRISAASSDKNVERSSYKILLKRKSMLIRTHLKRRHFQLLFIISKTIKQLLANGIFEAAFHLCSLYNNIAILTAQNMRVSSGSMIISNTHSSLMSNPKRLDISSILQLVTRYRTESCCSNLISCLLANSRADLQYDDDDSDTSSVLVFHALTKELSQSEEFNMQQHEQKLLKHHHHQKHKQQQQQQEALNDSKEIKLCSSSIATKPVTVPATKNDDPAINFFDNMTTTATAAEEGNEKVSTDIETHVSNVENGELLIELIRAEEIFIAHIIVKCLKFCPSAFEGEITKTEIMKMIEKASRFLWTHISGTLENFVLWWNHTLPLACRSVGCAKYLREWLLSHCDAPEPIQATLRGLGEILTIHVVGCLWDKQFRKCLILANNANPEKKFERNSEFYCHDDKFAGTTCGYFWNELLKSLVTITNSCDRAGTIASELPIVEQIPVLHRLDHSIHTMRLYVATIAKKLCSDWNMSTFFKIVHNDMNLCLEQLGQLRLPALVSSLSDVHISVNVALREKLVSEVKINRDKAKLTTSQCINDVFAKVCLETSLATLKIYFPPLKIWNVNHLKPKHNEYIDVYLDLIYKPVIESTKDMDILSLALKIIGEALLEHIYERRIKFSVCGAINLMKDFDGIQNWILTKTCNELPESYRDKLSRHEVLKVCEGVGKILLRQPDEIISMLPSKPIEKKGSTDDDDERAPLPPEMYINQQKWLELRATRRSALISCLCNNVNIIS